MASKLRRTSRDLLLNYLKYYGWTLLGILVFSALIAGMNHYETLADVLGFAPLSFITVMVSMVFALYTYSDFKYLIQNGVSRKTYWRGKALALLALAFIQVVCNWILRLVVQIPLMAVSNQHSYSTELVNYNQTNFFFNNFYSPHAKVGTWQLIIYSAICGLILAVMLYYAAMAVGAIFSLMTRKLQLITSIAGMVIGIYLLAQLAYWLDSHANMHQVMNSTFNLLFGVNSGLPHVLVAEIWMIVAIIIEAVISYYVMKFLKLRTD